jgi:hypothetical protein
MVTIGMSHRQSNLEEFVRPSEETEMPRSRSTAIQSERTRPLAPRLDLARQWIAPPKSKSFSVNVVLPASGCEMIAKVRRRAISSVRVLIYRR